MNLNLFKISENFVLGKLNSINNGNLLLQNYNGQIYNFGNENNILNAKI